MMNDAHLCAGGCGHNVRGGWVACYGCWKRLPQSLRSGHTQSDTGLKFRAAVVGWFYEHR